MAEHPPSLTFIKKIKGWPLTFSPLILKMVKGQPSAVLGLSFPWEKENLRIEVWEKKKGSKNRTWEIPENRTWEKEPKIAFFEKKHGLWKNCVGLL